jgi:DNA-binding CsgD family transcriptional regulator
MTLETAAEFLLLARPPTPQATPTLDVPLRWSDLSPRELELVALVARGRTDAQIAGDLHISISTVRSHLDRIRDKTSCRRRADLTRLALAAGLA